MADIPQDSSFVKELQYCHVVVILFKNEEGKMELGVWGYQNADDARKRFDKVTQFDNVKMATTFLIGLYENFEQSLFAEGSPVKMVM